MNKVLLISEDVLKTYSYINDNVQTDELRYAILTSQNIEIQESLGTNLYQYMLDLVETGDIFQPQYVVYKDLLDKFIQPALVGYSLHRALENFIGKFMSVGLVQNRSEQGNPVDFKLFLHMKTQAKYDADFQNNLLRRHLIFRSGLYPQYNSGNLGDGQLPPTPASPFQAPIAFASTGYYAMRNGRGRCWNAMGALCDDSPFPTWFGSANNSPGIPRG